MTRPTDVAATGTPRERIIDAAAELICTQGVHAASIAQIIKASGTSAGTIYHHFANKDEVVLAVAQAKLAEPLTEAFGRHARGPLAPSEIFRIVWEAVQSGTVESALIVQLWAASSLQPQLVEILRLNMAALHEVGVARITAYLEQQGDPDAAERAPGLLAMSIAQAMGFLAQRQLAPQLVEATRLEDACRMLDAAALPAGGVPAAR